MSRRMLLMFALFMVTAAFYATVTQQAAPELVKAQKSQVEMLNGLDEAVLQDDSDDELIVQHQGTSQ